MIRTRPLPNILIAIVALATLRSASGATFTVDSTLDLPDASPGDGACAAAGGACTLRAAVQEANALHPSLDTVVLPAGTYTLTIPPALANDDASGDLDVTDDIEIVGDGASSTIIDGNHTDTIIFGDLLTGVRDRIFLRGLTLQHGGLPTVVGGAIFSRSPIRLEDVVVRDNEADIGAGIYAAATLVRTVVTGNLAHACCGGIRAFTRLTLIDSTVADNHTINGPGGGILGYGEFEMTIVRSTISGNSAGERGGGIVFSGEEATIVDSTVSGNSAKTNGGGIFRDPSYDVGLGGEASGPVELENCTITGNTADSDATGYGNGGGVASPTPGVHLRNTIVAGNVDGGGEAPDCAATIESEGYNLVQSTLGCSFDGDTTGNLTGVSPLLGPLSDNGGFTHTHALLAGSPALDAGSPLVPGTSGNACSPLDQRGTPRPQPSRCDIGAYEEGVALCAAPRTGCVSALPRGAAVRVQRSPSGTGKLTWKWKGGGVASADFGAPLATTGYALCLFDTQAATPVSALEALVPPGSCAERPCWKTSTTGFAYRNKAATSTGIQALKLKASPSGSGAIALKGAGAALPVPALPLAHDPTVIVQLGRMDDAICWEARFGTAPRNDATTFSARSD